MVEVTRHEFLSNHFGSLSYLDHAKFQCTLAKGQMIAHPVGFERSSYLFGCKQFWIDEVVEPHLLKDTLVLWNEILIMVNACKGFLST